MLFGTDTLTRKQLKRVPTPERPPYEKYLVKRGSTNAGAYWEPINHGVLADAIVDRLENTGLQVKGETWTLCRKGLGLVGCVSLDSPEGLLADDMPEQTALSFGVRHSNDGQWALTCLVGATVFICTNGMLVGDFVMSRKHTTGLALDETIDHAIERYLEQVAEVPKLRKSLGDVDIPRRVGDSLIVDMAESGCFPYSMVPKVVKEWRDPRHKEWRDERNAWGLYMAVTEEVKARSSHAQVETMAESRDYLLSFAGQGQISLN